MNKNTPAKIFFGNKKITTSADGSIMFYNIDYAEAYRAKSVGAFTESFHKFVNASGIVEKAKKQDVRILDICFGLGYNCAVTLEYMQQAKVTNRVHIVSVELDSTLPLMISQSQMFWPVDGYKHLKSCIKEGRSGNFTMEMHNINALDFLKNVTGTFDAIYFDPFSIKKNPEMWSEAVFKRIYQLLSKDGCMVTYACGKTARDAMINAGLSVETVSTARGAFHPGTKAKRS